MHKIYLSYNTIVSAYGLDTTSAVEQMRQEKSSLQLTNDSRILPYPFYTSRLEKDTIANAFEQLKSSEEMTRLEQLMAISLSKTLKATGLELNERVGLIVSTTKGNIDALTEHNPFPQERAYLSVLGERLKSFFGFQNEALVLSNACVSGVLAVVVAKRLINQGVYDHVFVVGGDLVTQFILSGFNAFQALSKEPCRPYCKTRTGINIGELSASALVTKDSNLLCPEAVEIIGEASCNDANHISGPSRTGEGLYQSIQKALQQAAISARDIDYVSGHGTATQFNDEMEAIAFNRSDLQNVPLNSLKGYFGHTLGASGLLETIIGMHSLHQNTLFANLGFRELGVSKPLNIIQKTTETPLHTFLKTASGFGGCNTAAIFKKVAS